MNSKELEAVIDRLVAIHAVPAAKRAAFTARVKHFQRLGWPSGANTGKGKAAPYGERQFRELAITFELSALGLPAERAVETARTNYTTLFDAAERGTVCEIRVPPSFGDAMPRSTILVNLSALSLRAGAQLPAFDAGPA